MSKDTPADARLASVPDDAVTVPRMSGGEDGSMLVSISGAEVKDADARAAEHDALQAFVGQVLSDRYVIHELIGSGGMGAVYRGEQVHLRKRCAIKILLPGAARQQDLVLRFEREAIAGAHVEHPNVVGASDFGKLPDGSCFLVLDYVEGTPLEDVMKKGPLPAERVLVLARQIASALAAVHEKGIVHRDVKPRNILLDVNGQVKLLDFGLAKVNVELLSSESRNAKPAPALTGVGMVMGTLNYMAPEAAKGMDGVDARSDLYALGIVLYEMLSGKRPFDEKDPALLFKRLRSEPAPSIRERAPEVNVPAAVEALVAKLVEREPAARFAAANDVIAAIDAITSGGTTEAPAKAEEKPPEKASDEGPKNENAPAPAPAVPAAKKPLDKRIILAGAGALALVVIIVLVLVLRSSPEPDKPAPVAAPAPTPSSAAPTTPASLPVEIDGIDSAGWRQIMRKYIAKKDWLQASKALLALIKLDPEQVTGSELRGDVVAVVAGIGFETSFAESDQVFGALTNDLGPGGLDILFHVVRTRGGSKAAQRANEILSRPEVISRATPALRVALDLRRAACPDKRNFFAKAAEEGDGRALEELLIAQQAGCPSKTDPEMKDAISKLRARLQP